MSLTSEAVVSIDTSRNERGLLRLLFSSFLRTPRLYGTYTRVVLNNKSPLVTRTIIAHPTVQLKAYEFAVSPYKPERRRGRMLQFSSMIVLEAIQSFFLSLVIGYLGLTNSLAVFIEQHLALPAETPSEQGDTKQTTETASPTLTKLSRALGGGGGIARILRDNLPFQEALKRVDQSASLIEAPGKVWGDVSITRALVNILCEYKTDEFTRTTTGTGFFIHEQGVILTNAHVAQFLLLESADEKVRDVACVIRAGDPATPRYEAELLFISPTWIVNNAKLITEELPRGTGEYDYALLYISKSLTETPLPETFPSLPIYTDFLSKDLVGTKVSIAGYPAEKLMREGARAELAPAIAKTSIGELYTFGSNYADIFSVADSPVGEHGASGGPVLQNGHGVIGLIVTKGDDESEGLHSLRALSLSYIDRTITEETGFSLGTNAQGDLKERGEFFKTALLPFLVQLLQFEF